MKQVFLRIFIVLFIASPKLFGQTFTHVSKENWVNEQLNNMSIDQKIGQMLMLRAHSNKGPEHAAALEKLIKKYKIGSLCFFQGDPVKQAQLTNQFQDASAIPLIIAMDAEWGLGMRLPKSTISYPRQLTLGAIKDTDLIYNMGKQIAYELKRLGVQLSFSPVVDINNNPQNPVINNRSFGEDRYEVTAKSIAYMKGLQENGIIACAKHFPGHGDTDTDSHYALPRILHTKERLDSIELYPFKHMIQQGVKSMMIAHLEIPALDNRPNRPTTLSKKVVTDLLQNELGFSGLIVSDAMEMKGVSAHFKPGVAEAEAILAGNDILCLPLHVDKTIAAVKTYIKNGLFSEDRLNKSVRKILAAKYDLGLYIKPQVLINELEEDLNSLKGQALKGQLFEQAITLVKNDSTAIPYEQIHEKRFATLGIGGTEQTPFQDRVSSFVQAKHFNLSKNASSAVYKSLLKDLKKFDKVFVFTHNMSKYASKNFGLNQQTRNFIEALGDKTEVVWIIFGSPYAAKYSKNIKNVIVSYTDDPIMQDRTAQALFGVFDIRGHLPVSVDTLYKKGWGIHKSSLQRLGYALPEQFNMSSDTLIKLDSLVDDMIKNKAAPGCQILIARRGRVVYHKAYGTHAYDPGKPVLLDDIYDLASITKVAASTLSVMKLYNERKMDINGTLCDYVIGIDTTDKSEIKLKDALAHHAGLTSWIPFYKQTLDDSKRKKKPLDKYYRKSLQDSFSIKVAENLYMRNDYKDSIWHQIVDSDLRANTNYKYSDLGFYCLKEAIEVEGQSSLDLFTQEHFYKPLGLYRTVFNPLNTISKKNIVPTEKDQYFRNQTIHGYVHDMGAAMLGGVSGHAGLFSNSYELGVIMQLLLNKGNYGGKQYFSSTVVDTFTTRFEGSTRRGLGFDMKELDSNKRINMSHLASESTFGHLGFTGTAAFVDPEKEVIFIFLSNRTYPTMNNRKFGRKNYRPKAQTIMYKSILE